MSANAYQAATASHTPASGAQAGRVCSVLLLYTVPRSAAVSLSGIEGYLRINFNHTHCFTAQLLYWICNIKIMSGIVVDNISCLVAGARPGHQVNPDPAQAISSFGAAAASRSMDTLPLPAVLNHNPVTAKPMSPESSHQSAQADLGKQQAVAVSNTQHVAPSFAGIPDPSAQTGPVKQQAAVVDNTQFLAPTSAPLPGTAEFQASVQQGEHGQQSDALPVAPDAAAQPVQCEGQQQQPNTAGNAKPGPNLQAAGSQGKPEELNGSVATAVALVNFGKQSRARSKPTVYDITMLPRYLVSCYFTHRRQ